MRTDEELTAAFQQAQVKYKDSQRQLLDVATKLTEAHRALGRAVPDDFGPQTPDRMMVFVGVARDAAGALRSSADLHEQLARAQRDQAELLEELSQLIAEIKGRMEENGQAD